MLLDKLLSINIFPGEVKIFHYVKINVEYLKLIFICIKFKGNTDN